MAAAVVFVELRPRVGFGRCDSSNVLVTSADGRPESRQDDDALARKGSGCGFVRAGEPEIASSENDLIFGVVDDVGKLIRGQAEFECVDHRAIAGDGEVQLQMPEAVPAECSDAVARFEPKRSRAWRKRMDAPMIVRDRSSDAFRRHFAGDLLAGKKLAERSRIWVSVSG